MAAISISSVRLRRLSLPASEVAEGSRSMLSSTAPSLGWRADGTTSSARTEHKTSVSDPGRVIRDEPLDRTSGADDAMAAVLTDDDEDDDEAEGVMP